MIYSYFFFLNLSISFEILFFLLLFKNFDVSFGKPEKPCFLNTNFLSKFFIKTFFKINFKDRFFLNLLLIL